MDVVFKLADYQFLLANNALHEIAYRNNPNELFSIDHREMADAPVGHKRHALFNRMFRPRDKNLLFHNVANKRLRRGPAFQKNIACIVPFRGNTNKFVPVHHSQ